MKYEKQIYIIKIIKKKYQIYSCFQYKIYHTKKVVTFELKK